MVRAQRLLQLLQILRGHRYPVTGAHLCTELHISLRTLYRDIATLQAQGADIEGEAGIGYILKPGFVLPPLMFSAEEVEALVLGLRWIGQHTDSTLGNAAKNAGHKISAVLPSELRALFDASSLLIAPSKRLNKEQAEIHLPLLRQAIRAERKLRLHYQDVHAQPSLRTVWPFAIGFFDEVSVLVAWCELREAFRHFRCDRIASLRLDETRYPKRRQILLKEWREQEGIEQT